MANMEPKDINLSIVGLGGAGLAALRHMVTDLKKNLGPNDVATITVIDEFGNNAGGHTYRKRGGDSVTTASHIDSMGIGDDPAELLKIMNAQPAEWEQYVKPDRRPAQPGAGFDPNATITYVGYHRYMNHVREQIEEECRKDGRIKLKFIRGKVQMIEDYTLADDASPDAQPKKLITYRNEEEKDHHIGDLDGVVFCPGNGLPNPHMSLCSKINPEVYRGRFDDITEADVERTKNVILLGSGNGAIAAIMKLRQEGFGYQKDEHGHLKTDPVTGNPVVDPEKKIYVMTINDDYPHRNLKLSRGGKERPQGEWERHHFNAKKVGKLVLDKGEHLQAADIKNLINREFEDMLIEIRKENPEFDPETHYKTHRNEPWSQAHDWRDILDSLDRDAKTGALRDDWNEIMALLPAKVLADLEKDKEGLVKRYTGASWVNSRHRTPVDHWKIVDEMIDDHIIQTNYSVATTHPPVSLHGKKHTVEATVNSTLRPGMAEYELIAKSGKEAMDGFIKKYEELLAEKKVKSLRVKEIRADEDLQEISGYFKGEDGDKKISAEKFNAFLTPHLPKTHTIRFDDALVVNTAGHTTTIDTIDNAALKHMANHPDEPLLMRGPRCGVLVADVTGMPYRKKRVDGVLETMKDPQLRIVGACTEGGCWNKTIMVDLNRNAKRASHSLLQSLEVIPPAIDTSQGPATMSAEAQRARG